MFSTGSNRFSLEVFWPRVADIALWLVYFLLPKPALEYGTLGMSLPRFAILSMEIKL